MTDAATGPNAAMHTNWNTASAPVWIAQQAVLDQQLGPLGDEAMAALGPKSGETIIDVGCGCGTTSRQLARLVGPSGHVLALDISAPMLQVASEQARAEALNQITCQAADAQIHPFEPASADGIFSRFGVMFFIDPPAAFANLRLALKRGGRLAFVCWKDDNWINMPMRAVTAAIPEAPPLPAPVPGAPGPMAFQDPARVRDILQASGFADIGVREFHKATGVGTMEETLPIVLDIGPLGRALRERPDWREPAIAALGEAFAPYVEEDGQVRLTSGVWIVTATNP